MRKTFYTAEEVREAIQSGNYTSGTLVTNRGGHDIKLAKVSKYDIIVATLKSPREGIISFDLRNVVAFVSVKHWTTKELHPALGN